MGGIENIDPLESARNLLRTSLEKSSHASSALDESGARLERMKQRWESSLPKKSCTLVDIGDQIDGLIGPTAAVLKVFDSVCELEKSLSTETCFNLSTHLTDMKRLEEALKFLAENCVLAIKWLDGIVDLLAEKGVNNDSNQLNLEKCRRVLQELEAMQERARLEGGVLAHALDKLEDQFRQLLIKNSIPLPMSTFSSYVEQQKYISEPIFPGNVIVTLQAIVGRLNANERIERCKRIYAEVRGLNVQRSLQALDMSYLKVPITKSEEMESYIDQWSRHLELTVKILLELEFTLCSNVFDKFGPQASLRCFAEIATQSGILSLLQFGSNIAKGKKDPIKLLRLLDIFRVLDNLRLDFNRLFSGEGCEGIRTLTRDLIKRVINGAFSIFLELPAQVKSQRRSPPPLDGSVPSLVSFITNYCSDLLEDRYKPYLTQVFKINLRWRQETCEEGIVFNQVYYIIKEIALNLDAWSKSYEDISLSYLFMMNNHCHFHNMRNTNLGIMMGDSWLRAHEQYKDYYAGLYMKESWGKLLVLINQKGQLSNQEMVKKVKAFNVAFDERYKKQSSWVIPDEMLREKVCKNLVEGIAPIYRNFMQNYYLLSDEKEADKYVKYTARSLEDALSSLFQPKKKYGSMRYGDLVGKIKELVSQQFHLTLTAA